MMVNDQPVVTTLDVGKTVSRRQRFGFALLHIGERVVARVDGRGAIDAYALLAERDLESGQDLECCHEIVTQRSAIGPQGRRQCAPQNGVLGVERQDLVGLVLAKRLRPRGGGRRHLVLRLGRGQGGKRQEDDAEHTYTIRGFQGGLHDLISRVNRPAHPYSCAPPFKYEKRTCLIAGCSASSAT